MGTPGIAAHEAAIEGYLKDLEVIDALVDPGEQAAERKRVEKALAELEAEVKRNVLAATTAKKLVGAEPESVIFGQSDGRQPSYNVRQSLGQRPVGADGQAFGARFGVRPPASDPTTEAAAGAAADAPDVPTAPAAPAPATTEPSAATPPVMLIADTGYSSANDAIACEKLRGDRRRGRGPVR